MELCAEDKNGIRNKTKEHTETLDHCVMIQLLQESGCASALVLSFNSFSSQRQLKWYHTHKNKPARAGGGQKDQDGG